MRGWMRKQRIRREGHERGERKRQCEGRGDVRGRETYKTKAPWVPVTLNPSLRSILEPPMQSSPTHCNRGFYRESLPPPYAQVAR